MTVSESPSVSESFYGYVIDVRHRLLRHDEVAVWAPSISSTLFSVVRINRPRGSYRTGDTIVLWTLAHAFARDMEARVDAEARAKAKAEAEAAASKEVTV